MKVYVNFVFGGGEQDDKREVEEEAMMSSHYRVSLEKER